MNNEKFRINYKYLLTVCENLATVHEQSVSEVDFKNNEVIIKFQSHIELIIPESQFKEILIDQLSSELRINCIKLDNFELDQNGKPFIEISSFQYE